MVIVNMRISRQQTTPLYEILQDRHAFNSWRDESEEDQFYKHLLNAFRVAIANELSETQRAYIDDYYFCNKTMVEIADEFSVNVSTVSRTIKLAEKRLERVLRYATPTLLQASMRGGYIGMRKSNRKDKE